MIRDVRVVTVTTGVVVHCVGYDALCAIGIMVTQNEHGCRGHVPAVVGVADEVPEDSIIIATAFAYSKDFSWDTLLSPELLDAIG